MKLSDNTICNIRDHLFKKLQGQLIETETLFYVLTDEVGLSNDCAKFFALECYSGGRVFDAKEVRTIIKNRWKAYELNPKQSARFVNRQMMKSSRIALIDDAPFVWELNGFATNQPPYIAGYERKVNA